MGSACATHCKPPVIKLPTNEVFKLMNDFFFFLKKMELSMVVHTVTPTMKAEAGCS